ncbi:polysaccharide biosynthesis protein [Syntrophomonas erecta]
MNERMRTAVLVILDAILISLSFYVALLIRFEGTAPSQYLLILMQMLPLFTGISLALFWTVKLYSRIWEYTSISEMFAIFRATTYSLAVILIVTYFFHLPILSRSIYLLAWILMNIFIGASRLSWRLCRYYLFGSRPKQCRRVLIIGAGDAGAMLVREIRNNPHLNMKVIGFIDDEKNKHQMMLSGIKVLGNRKKIPLAVEALQIDEIIIAMPSVHGEAIREIVDICKKTPARIKILPAMNQTLNGRGNLLATVRDVQMEDLLRREPIRTDLKAISGYICGKTVLVTGAGGSIGSELCRQLARLSPAKLIMLDCCENNLFDIEMELQEGKNDPQIIPLLADIKDIDKLNHIFETYQPQVVFHAAAYKHVPMMERHPEEAVSNNIIGTRNVALAADHYAAEVFIQISTDKAVNPTSIMGASKRVAELIIKDIGRTSSTKFAAVRFGNVLGSRGSVIPTFLKQIAQGGPVTVTHPDMTRYFMTIPEAVQLVIQAGAMATGGETFVLDMGEPVKIMDLAADLIRISGYEPDKDIEIKITGIRPGEKLYEELFTSKEKMAATKHERIFISDKEPDGIKNIGKTIMNITKKDYTTNKDVIDMIIKLIPEYHPGQKESAVG